MKIIVRHFLTTLRRFKTASVLNIIGLSAAFTTFMLIMIQVRYEYGYGKADSKYERIFRLESYDDFETCYGPTIRSDVGRPLADGSPEVEKWVQVVHGKNEISVEWNGEKTVYRHVPEICVSGNLPAIFDFRMKEGIFPADLAPGQVVIPESMARLYLGEESAIGRPLRLRFWRDRRFHGEFRTVVGVYYDLPAHAMLPNAAITSLGNDYRGYSSFYCLLRDPSKAGLVVETYMASHKEDYARTGASLPPRLLPIGDAYFSESSVKYAFLPHGDRMMTYTLSSIAVLVLLIAIVNFINFSTALTPVRVRGINVRRICGESLASLRLSMVAEALGFCLIAYGIALCLSFAFTDSSLGGLLKTADPGLWHNGEVVLMTAAVVVSVAFVAGLYPAFYSTSFRPAMAFKGSSALTPKGKVLRVALIGFQYTVSAALIVLALFIVLQNRYVENHPLGYDKENIVTVAIDDPRAAGSAALANRLKENPNIVDFAFESGAFGVYNCSLQSSLETAGDTVDLNVYFVGPGFLETMKIPLIEGRSFRSGDASFNDIFNSAAGKVTVPVVVDRKTAGQLGLKVDAIIPEYQYDMRIIGITDNFVSTTMHEPSGYTAFCLGDVYQINIRLTEENQAETVEYIKGVLDELFGRQQWEIVSYGERLSALYRDDRNFGILILLFSTLSILISLVGVFGLIAFETQFRTKEIGLRKINGASTGQVLAMFNRYFLLIGTVSCAVSTPLAYYAVGRWLEGFAYRIPVYGWVFAAVGAAILFFTLLTVTARCWRTANANPVDSIRTE